MIRIEVGELRHGRILGAGCIAAMSASRTARKSVGRPVMRRGFLASPHGARLARMPKVLKTVDDILREVRATVEEALLEFLAGKPSGVTWDIRVEANDEEGEDLSVTLRIRPRPDA